MFGVSPNSPKPPSTGLVASEPII